MKRFYLVLLSLCLTTFAIYANTLQNAFVNYDDPALLVENRQVLQYDFKTAFTSVVAEDYIPLVTTSFAAENALFGMDPFYFHLGNLIMHTINVALVFTFLYLITSGGLFVAATAALLFSVHPLHVESVAWLAERKDVLSTLFFLVSLITYWLVFKKPEKKYFYAMSLLSFTLALFAKFMAISLPAILLMIHFRNRTSLKKSLWMQLPFAIIGGVFTYIHLLLHNRGEHLPENQDSVLSALQRGMDSLAFYIHKMLVPINLSAYYERGVAQAAWPEYLALLFFVLGVIWLAKKSEKNKAAAFAGSLFFLLTIFPVLQIISFGNKFAFADRFMYLPSLGLFYFLAVAASEKVISRIFIVIITIPLMYLTFERNKAWASSETLWEDEVVTYPDSSVAQNNLGSLYLDQGKYDAAILHLQKSADLKPTYADPRINLGLVYLELNRLPEAQAELEHALRLDPRSAKAYLNMGVVQEKRGNIEGAFQSYQSSVDYDPDLSISRHNLGVGYYRKKQLDKALEVFHETIRRDPMMPETHHNIGVVLTETGRNAEAISYFKQAIALDPLYVEPHIQLLQIYQKSQDLARAAEEVQAIQTIQARLKEFPPRQRPRRIK
jgi:tetratricopeptide (TPR) repeat protein